MEDLNYCPRMGRLTMILSQNYCTRQVIDIPVELGRVVPVNNDGTNVSFG